jgi:hypothetical protein
MLPQESPGSGLNYFSAVLLFSITFTSILHNFSTKLGLYITQVFICLAVGAATRNLVVAKTRFAFPCHPPPSSPCPSPSPLQPPGEREFSYHHTICTFFLPNFPTSAVEHCLPCFLPTSPWRGRCKKPVTPNAPNSLPPSCPSSTPLLVPELCLGTEMPGKLRFFAAEQQIEFAA